MPSTFEPVFGGVYCQIKAHYGTLPGTMIMGLKFAGSSDLPTWDDCQAINDLVEAWVGSDLVDVIASNWNIFALYTKSMAVEVPPFEARDEDFDGTLSTTLHPEAAPEILFHTHLAGRSYLGRSYVFAPDDGSITATGFNAGHLTTLVNKFNSLAVAAEVAGYPLVVASKKLAAVQAVQSFTHVNRYTVQKRRRIGFGG